MFELIKERINEKFKGRFYIAVEEFGITINDHGNEHYITVCFGPPRDIDFYDAYENWIDYFTKRLQEVLNERVLDGGDHSCTLECVTHGNDTMIALITMCK